MTDEELEYEFRAFKETGRKYSVLAKKTGLSKEVISRYKTGRVSIRRASQKTKDKFATAFKQFAVQDLLLDARPFSTIDSHREIEALIEQKLLSDFKLSAISDRSQLDKGGMTFDERAKIISTIPEFGRVRDVGQLRGYGSLQGELRNLVTRSVTSGPYNEQMKADIAVLRTYSEKHGPLRASCNIQLGPLATFMALKEHRKIAIEIDIRHASGVELMHDVATQTGKPLDFIVCTTGAFNMTLVAFHNIVAYHPVIPVCYEIHEYLYDSRMTRGAPSKPSVVVAYDLSAGYEDVLVGIGKQEIPKVEIRREDQFASLMLLFRNNLDTGKAVNLWQPLSTVLQNRQGWVRTALRPYKSLLVLYQHERFSREQFSKVSAAMRRLFVFEWNRLKRCEPSEVTGLFWRNSDLKVQFLRGAGLNLVLPDAS